MVMDDETKNVKKCDFRLQDFTYGCAVISKNSTSDIVVMESFHAAVYPNLLYPKV